MSWPAVGTFIKDMLKSPWMKNQAPHVVVLFVILGIVSAYIFDVHPREQQESRETWKQLRADIQDGHERIEAQQSRQVDRISTEFRDAREQDLQIIQSLLKGKLAGAANAAREVGNAISANVTSEADDGNEATP